MSFLIINIFNLDGKRIFSGTMVSVLMRDNDSIDYVLIKYHSSVVEQQEGVQPETGYVGRTCPF